MIVFYTASVDAPPDPRLPLPSIRWAPDPRTTGLVERVPMMIIASCEL